MLALRAHSVFEEICHRRYGIGIVARQEWQKDKKRPCNIEKELRRKEEALAEVAALLWY
uniref:Uncharacterized protein n=1 Tax=Candidatus Kentrum sp. LPFa TaxID=2126335 RepID=A0A450XE95_9GAMM|nr:MAG: hypothetical protein BECKLPF1236A_GA0070988_1005010 [Candidatus Kentron sp. LPFa]VFK27559.1 MAG: hypothetical protein BECKLPF1236C_GA0070990_1004810 [Candidatus Kentron sp. LPFa]